MIQNYIGTRDFLPDDWKVMNYVFNTWRKVSEQYGFLEYDAPTIAPLELFTEKSGEEIKKQLFWFKDKGEREICLRAELTPQLARLIINYGKSIKKPIKWYSIPRVFRYEKPQRGRYREFFQYNVDVIGEESVLATVEVIKLGINILKSFGLKSNDFIVRVNSRKIVDDLIRRLGVADKAAFYLLLDKKDKMKESEFYKELKGLTKEVDLLKRLFSLNTSELLYELDKLGYEVKRLKELFKSLDKSFVKFDLSIVRGLAYYTDIVFEAFDKEMGYKRSVFAGGEYNNLISDFGGEKTPAVGFGSSAASLIELLKEKKKLPKFEEDTVFIASIGNVQKDVFKLREKLIKKGLKVDIDLGGKSISKQLSYAESRGYPTVYILGEKDLSKGVITVKNMNKGTEKKVKKV